MFHIFSRNSSCKTSLTSICLFISLFLVLALTFPSYISRANGYIPQGARFRTIDDQTVTIVLRDTSVKNALHALSNRADIQIGFIGIDGEDGRPKKINVRAVQRSIREVLDEVVLSDNRYKWEMRDGIINVLPVASQDKISELKIEFLQLCDVEVINLGSAILDAPEVHKQLEALGKKKTDELNYSGRPIRNAKISETFSNITIRDSLNKLLNRRAARFWAIEKFGGNDDFVRIILFD